MLGPVRGESGLGGAPGDRGWFLPFHGGRVGPHRPGTGTRDVRGLRRPELRTCRGAARPACGTGEGPGTQHGGAAGDHQGRRGGFRRRRPAGGGADLPHPRRPDHGGAGLDRRPLRRPRPGRAAGTLPAPALHRREPAAPADPQLRARRTGAGRPAGGDARRAGGGAGPGPRRQTHPPGDRAAQRRAVPAAAGSQAGLGPDHPEPGAGGDRRCPGPGGTTPAHRVLRHLTHPGHRGRRLHGGLRGRPGPQIRLPAVRHQELRGIQRRRGHGRGAEPSPRQAAGRTLPRRGRVRAAAGGPHHRRPPQVLLRARPDRRRRWRPAGDRGRAGAGGTRPGRGDRPVRAGQTPGGGVAARRGVPRDPAPRVRGAVPAAAGP